MALACAPVLPAAAAGHSMGTGTGGHGGWGLGRGLFGAAAALVSLPFALAATVVTAAAPRRPGRRPRRRITTRRRTPTRRGYAAPPPAYYAPPVRPTAPPAAVYYAAVICAAPPPPRRTTIRAPPPYYAAPRGYYRPATPGYGRGYNPPVLWLCVSIGRNAAQGSKAAALRRGRPSSADALRLARAHSLGRGNGAVSRRRLRPTSIEAVAERARFSKRTFYDRFDDKAALFAAVVHRIIENIRPRSRGPADRRRHPRGHPAPTCDVHAARGARASGACLAPAGNAESARFPDSCAPWRAMPASGGDQSHRQPSRAGAAANSTAENREFAAAQFIFMVVAFPRRRAMGYGSRMTEDELEVWAGKVVGLVSRRMPRPRSAEYARSSIARGMSLLCGLLRITRCACAAGAAPAWGDEGHEVIGLIAQHYLARGPRPRPSSSSQAMTAVWSRATSRTRHLGRQVSRLGSRHAPVATMPRATGTSSISRSAGADLNRACYGRPPLPAGLPASQGPAEDCVVDKIEEFSAELAISGDRSERSDGRASVSAALGRRSASASARERRSRSGRQSQDRERPRYPAQQPAP